MREQKRKISKLPIVIVALFVMLLSTVLVYADGLDSQHHDIKQGEITYYRATDYINVKASANTVAVYSSLQGNYDGSLTENYGSGATWIGCVKTTYVQDSVYIATGTYYNSPKMNSRTYVWDGFFEGYGAGSNRVTDSRYLAAYNNASAIYNLSDFSYTEYYGNDRITDPITHTLSIVY